MADCYETLAAVIGRHSRSAENRPILHKRKLDSGLTCRDAPGAHSPVLLEHCEVNTAQIDCLQLQGLFGYYEIYRPPGIGH